MLVGGAWLQQDRAAGRVGIHLATQTGERRSQQEPAHGRQRVRAGGLAHGFTERAQPGNGASVNDPYFDDVVLDCSATVDTQPITGTGTTTICGTAVAHQVSGAGTNVVTTCSDMFARGVRLSDDNHARVVETCERSGASVWASGSDPGFATETLPMALLSVQRHVDLIEIEEFGDLSHRPSAHMVLEQMRFGKPLAEFDPDRRKKHLFGEYQPPLGVLADLAGFTIDEWVAEGGVAAAKEDDLREHFWGR